MPAARCKKVKNRPPSVLAQTLTGAASVCREKLFIMKNSLFQALATAAMLALSSCSGCKDDGPDGPENGGTADTLLLPMNQQVPFGQNDIKVTLINVFEDSRCPDGFACIWEGRADAIFVISQKPGSYLDTLGIGASVSELTWSDSTERYNCRFRLLDILPHPDSMQATIPQESYVAKVAVYPL